MRAFWSVKEAGGVQNGPLRESGLWMLQFSSKLNFKKKKKDLKRNPQIILGFFDPDPVLLAKQGAEQRIKKSQNDLRIKLQNFVFYNLDQ